MSDLTVTQIKGLIPLLDRKKIPEPFVCDGQNFFCDLDGPLAGFGRTLVLNGAIYNPSKIQDFRIESTGEVFIFTIGAVLKYDSVSTRLYPVYTFTDPGTVFPWSMAVVGGMVYFAKYGTDLIQYDPTTGNWSTITGANVPANIYAITQSAGRLIVAADGLVAYSAIDDGTNLAPSTTTGAGAQALSIMQSGAKPLAVLEVADGFLTYTTAGILKSTAVQALYAFRHVPLSRRHIPINPYCVIELATKQHVMLTRSGMYDTTGGVPNEWQPIMGEYLHTQILPNYDLTQQEIIRLTYDFDRQWFFVSIAENQQPDTYTKAYMLYLPSNEWGVFNKVHMGFMDVHLTTGPFEGFNFGYCDNNGTMWRFSDTQFDLVAPTLSTWIYRYRPTVEYPSRMEDGVIKFAEFTKTGTVDESKFSAPAVYNLQTVVEEQTEPTQIASFAEQASTTSAFIQGAATTNGLLIDLVTPASNEKASLDSYIYVGVFRFTDNKYDDELSMINNLSISVLDSPTKDVYDDWLLDYNTAVYDDWAADSGSEDWGFGTNSGSDYDVYVQSTLDGYKTWNDFYGQPSLVQQSGRTRFYACDSNGIYHLIELSAQAVDKFYHLKTMHLTGVSTGRL